MPPISSAPPNLHALHALVLAGDAAARDRAASILIVACSQRLAYMRSRFSAATINESIEDAVLNYLAHPENYREAKLALTTFIERAAVRNLIDWYRAESARHLRESAWATEFRRVHAQPEDTAATRAPHDVWPLLLAEKGPLTDDLWMLVAALFTDNARPARSGRRSSRQILDGVVAMIRRGGPWRDLPRHFPPYSTCYRYFRRWSSSGVLKNALDRLEAGLQSRRGAHVKQR